MRRQWTCQAGAGSRPGLADALSGGDGVILGVSTAMCRCTGEAAVASCQGWPQPHWPAPEPWTVSGGGRWSGSQDANSAGNEEEDGPGGWQLGPT